MSQRAKMRLVCFFAIKTSPPYAAFFWFVFFRRRKKMNIKLYMAFFWFILCCRAENEHIISTKQQKRAARLLPHGSFSILIYYFISKIVVTFSSVQPKYSVTSTSTSEVVSFKVYATSTSIVAPFLMLLFRLSLE